MRSAARTTAAAVTGSAPRFARSPGIRLDGIAAGLHEVYGRA
ncbi:hypothetical protein [Sphaerisporangium flaviroseum]